MPIVKTATAALVISIAAVTAAPAQPVIQEPGYCAFFYPNANCNNKGPGNPYTDPNFHRNQAQGWQGWADGTTVGVAPQRRPRTRATAARPQ
ncbi:hypothetical protein [Bradyrhizobium sp. NP1]|uniref:hypothetical protein n=1 Tax=Bradyrhizobium sp. NP1 TaxID=3049772 RepID=UPI0025A510E2|nr:hypothetical protein [Bradyrhizobium sp. NP1]WJR81547.1 hypothetical protein QOU61_17920 [Bradyrhizobium sp. NP1]